MIDYPFVGPFPELSKKIGVGFELIHDPLDKGVAVLAAASIWFVPERTVRIRLVEPADAENIMHRDMGFATEPPFHFGYNLLESVWVGLVRVHQHNSHGIRVRDEADSIKCAFCVSPNWQTYGNDRAGRCLNNLADAT
jgi:hypothetical protein